jgi:hypothetical protein
MTTPRYCLDSDGISVLDLEKKSLIPFVYGNRDFEQVLNWIKEGNSLGPLTPEVLAELEAQTT